MKVFSLPRYSLKQLSGKDARDMADDISMYVQKHGGQFSIHRHCVNFYVPDEYALFVKIMYPFLEEACGK